VENYKNGESIYYVFNYKEEDGKTIGSWCFWNIDKESRCAEIGAPAAAMNLEELISYGAKRVYELGFAGAIDAALEPGDIVVLKRAFSDEGTSRHYFRRGTWFGSSRNLTRQLEKSLREGGMKYSLGEAWTTEAQYRETREKVARYRRMGARVVNMESSAVFAVSSYRGGRSDFRSESLGSCFRREMGPEFPQGEGQRAGEGCPVRRSPNNQGMSLPDTTNRPVPATQPALGRTARDQESTKHSGALSREGGLFGGSDKPTRLLYSPFNHILKSRIVKQTSCRVFYLWERLSKLPLGPQGSPAGKHVLGLFNKPQGHKFR
jgi:hypothetical protein